VFGLVVADVDGEGAVVGEVVAGGAADAEGGVCACVKILDGVVWRVFGWIGIPVTMMTLSLTRLGVY